MTQYKIFTDGGARGNPGPAAIGCVIYKQEAGKAEEIIWQLGECIGNTTNNQAEYRALLKAIQKAKELKIKEVICFLDSELVVKQLKREYRVKDQDLAKLFVQIWNLIPSFNRVTFQHVPRAQNKMADSLVNQALDLVS